MKKLLSFSCAFLFGVTAWGASVNMTVIYSGEFAAAGEDPALTAAIAQLTGGEINKTLLNYQEALGKEEFAGVDMSFMPVYLVEKKAELDEKFAPFLERNILGQNEKYIIFARQTRNGLFVTETDPALKNTLEVFIMTLCPYGLMAQNRILQAYNDDAIGKDIKIRFRHMAQDDGRGGFRALHGSPEWEESVRQLLIVNYYPNKYMKYLDLRNKDPQSSDWPTALEGAGISLKKIRSEFDKTGKKLLREDINYGNKFMVNSSPTYIWEGRLLADPAELSKIKGLEFLAPQPRQGGGPMPQPMPEGSC